MYDCESKINRSKQIKSKTTCKLRPIAVKTLIHIIRVGYFQGNTEMIILKKINKNGEK